MKTPRGILETCLYVSDLSEARRFYEKVLGAQPFMEEAGRHVFLRIGQSLVFLFDPRVTAQPLAAEGPAVPTHGAHGPGHAAFVIDEDIEEWKGHLRACGVSVEQIVDWPNGARSLYFRDPSGNSLELATNTLWQDQLASLAN